MSPTRSARRSFTCKDCGASFSLSLITLDRYPGWTPSRCPGCFAGEPKSAGGPPRVETAAPPDRTPGDAPVPAARSPDGFAECSEVPEGRLQDALVRVLSTCHAGPKDGVFTDGACHGNPGPGGWAAVHVRRNHIVALRFGREPSTTNNRMELRALIAAYEMLGSEDEVTVFSDSELCVNTINKWADAWERRGWRRKEGPVKNLDLVRPLYELARARPRVKLCWVRAHAGARWNEYVDTLADPELP